MRKNHKVTFKVINSKEVTVNTKTRTFVSERYARSHIIHEIGKFTLMTKGNSLFEMVNEDNKITLIRIPANKHWPKIVYIWTIEEL